MAGRLGQELLEGIATAALAATLVVGSAFVWIGIPLGGLWLAGQITADPNHFLLLGLCSIPTAMVVFGWLLYRVNSLYEGLRSRGSGAAAPQRSAWLRSSSDERRAARGAGAPRALIDVAMAGSAWLAVILMAIWFFFFAELRLVSW